MNKANVRDYTTVLCNKALLRDSAGMAKNKKTSEVFETSEV